MMSYLKLKQNYKAYLLSGYAFLLFIHFVLKDYIFPVSTIYYSFPILILIAIGAVLTVITFRKKIYSLALSLIVLILIAHWFNNYYYTNNTNTALSSKVLFWNVAKEEHFPIDIIVEEVKINEPEILAFVEAKYLTKTEVELLSKALPEYEFKDLDANMLVGVKGQLLNETLYTVEESHNIYLIEATANIQHIKVIIADIYAYPFINKEPPLNRVLEIAKANEVSIIMGDFNTPYESVHFKDYFEYYTSFHSFNNGFTATWPLGIPLFEIDHIWIGKEYTPVALEKKYYEVSDHALLIAAYN